VKRLGILIVILGALAVAGPSYASVLRARIEIQTAAPNPAYVAHVERAIERQVNTQVIRHWVVPTLQFVSTGPVGLVVHLETHAAVDTICGGEDDGCHYPATNGVIDVYVDRWAGGCGDGDTGPCGYQDWSYPLSHEIIESLVDPTANSWSPTGLLLEACDPVDGSSYQDLGIDVSDFVYPRWFNPNATGDQMDWTDMVHRPEPDLGYSGYALKNDGTWLGGAPSPLS
jgi:hypothetical protein